jgi:hypothetical protein
VLFIHTHTHHTHARTHAHTHTHTHHTHEQTRIHQEVKVEKSLVSICTMLLPVIFPNYGICLLRLQDTSNNGKLRTWTPELSAAAVVAGRATGEYANLYNTTATSSAIYGPVHF